MAASERDEGGRRAWREPLSGVDPRRLVFVNECSTNAALATRYARAPKGQRTRGRAPRNWGKNVTLNSSISLVGTGPSLSIEGPADDEAFGFKPSQRLPDRGRADPEACRQVALFELVARTDLATDD